MTAPQLVPLTRFFRESLLLISSHNYLLRVELTALERPDSDLGQKHQFLNSRVPDVYGGPTPYFLARLFISYIASFEYFLQEIITIVVGKNPKKVGATPFTLSDVLNAPDVTLLIQRATEDLLNKMMYRKPLAYLDEICEVLSIDRLPMKDDWLLFIEGKARRDLGVHNAWRCNEVYLRKLKEAGMSTSALTGDLLLPVDDDYLDTLTDAMNRLAIEVTKQVLAVHWPDLNLTDFDPEADA